ncbi:MAG: hypothetical protein AB1512_28020 [Thermodesulfobacteriota bacterium]
MRVSSFSRIRRGIGLVLLASVLFFAHPPECRSYILPAEQIIRSMGSQVSRFGTLLVEQITRQAAEGGADAVRTYKERVMMAAPDIVHSEVLEGSVPQDTARPDSRYRTLFLLNSEAGLARFLSGLGIDLQQVSYARIEHHIAYRMGGIEPESPQILVEKDTFLPLLLVYPDADTGARMSVHFRDYKRIGGRWYPFQVTITSQGNMTLHTVQSLQADVRLPFPSGAPPRKVPSPSTRPSDGWDKEKEDRVKQLIRAFEEM